MAEQSIFEQDIKVESDTLKHLSTLAQDLVSLEKEIEERELKLSELKKNLERLSREDIPQIMNNLGLSQIKLSTGETLTIADKIKANIAKKNLEIAFANMVNGEKDLIAQKAIAGLFKSEISIEGEDPKILELLVQNNIPYNTSKDIHYQTLNKYCREQIENGKPIPEGISVFQYQETKIKK